MLHRSLHAFPWAGSPSAGEPADLPDTYGIDILMLAPVDPERLFAGWHIAWSTRNRLLEEFGEETLPQCRLLLRLHAEDSDEPCSEIDVSGPARSWYFDLECVGSRFFAELACQGPDGRLVRVARSQPIDVPRVRPTAETDPDWAPVEEAYERIARGAGVTRDTLFGAHGCLALAQGRDERLGRDGVPGRP